ncbi:MAG: cyclic nucleotide-binding domain-containing protein, partial [Bacteroidetes bacterium]|nr:cyclic nucleotide-binding domain-containing protein [Fibrella sp.]
LGQLYDPGSVADAQRGIHHAARDREANALEMLDNLMPHTVYRGVQAVVGALSLVEMHRAIDRLVGRLDGAEPFSDYIIWRADTVFSAWTVAMALRHWSPDTPHTDSLFPLLESPDPLVQESALDALQRLPMGQWGHFHTQLAASSYQIPVPMPHTTTNHISATSRVLALKRTALFTDTPENVLASIVPIMKEVTFSDGQEIFTKGDPGDCMFIVYEGEVGIFDGPTQFATVTKGGFFGELALLDTESRSASAVALENVTAFRIDQVDFYDLTEERSEVLQSIIRVLCQRLRKQNELLRA